MSVAPDTPIPDLGLAPIAGEGWSVRLLDGPSAGGTWPILSHGLMVGRGLGCHVRLDDPRVSRTHCEFRITDDGVELSNLSERNPTQLNGHPVANAPLQHGDIVEVASFRLQITTGQVAQARVRDSHTTLSMSAAIHTREDADLKQYEHRPDLTSDLHSLFHLLRALSRADSLDMLVDILRAHLLRHLNAAECWVAWRVRLDGEITLYPPASTADTQRAPLRLLQEACSLREGLLPNRAESTGVAHLAAPLIQGAVGFGAVAISRLPDAPLFTGRELDYLVSVAECAAPLVRAAEYLERLRRDELLTGPQQSASPRMLGSSPAMERLRREIRRAALGKANVLITGETGAGKELAARTLHDLSPRSSGPYVTVNCAAIPADLFESEMFGHERGAFTGAGRSRKGMFELAHGGTLFLDEVGDLSLPNQARLLRVVETGTFYRIGAEKEVRVDVRIVSATNRPLPDAAAIYFRSDLFHRLASIEITVPPLRERRPDVPELAQFYLDEFSRHSPARPRAFTREAIDALCLHQWPGNIREFRNTIERACYSATRDVISLVDLGMTTLKDHGLPLQATQLQTAEKRQIVAVLEQCGWKVAEAATLLGLSKSTMYYKLSRHRIDVKRRQA